MVPQPREVDPWRAAVWRFSFAEPVRLGSGVFLMGFLTQPRGKKSKNIKAKRC